jgi:hypothetical protein
VIASVREPDPRVDFVEKKNRERRRETESYVSILPYCPWALLNLTHALHDGAATHTHAFGSLGGALLA